MSFETLYSWCGIDFSTFPNLRPYFNANLFQSFAIVALVTAVVIALLYYFVIANIRVKYSKLKYWFGFLIIAALSSALITFLLPWSNIAQARTQNVGQQPVLNAINEGHLKYAFIDNLLITALLYFIISLIIKRWNPNTIYTPFKIRKT